MVALAVMVGVDVMVLAVFGVNAMVSVLVGVLCVGGGVGWCLMR